MCGGGAQVVYLGGGLSIDHEVAVLFRALGLMIAREVIQLHYLRNAVHSVVLT